MAMEFNGIGSGQHVDLGNFDLPSGLSAMSIGAWVLFNNFDTSDQRICSKATSYDVPDHWFMLSGNNSNQMRFRLKTNGTTTTHYEDNLAIAPGVLYHITAVYNGSTVQFYRNGQPNGSSAKSGTINTNGAVGVRIADNPGIHRKEFDGVIEDVSIWTRALSAEEVSTLYHAHGGDNLIYGLEHRWYLNEGPAGTAASGAGANKDLTGKANGTPAASPLYRASTLTFNRALWGG